MSKVGGVGENDNKYKKNTLAAIIAAGGKNMPTEGVVGENDNNKVPAQGVADKKDMAKMDVVGDNKKKNKNKLKPKKDVVGDKPDPSNTDKKDKISANSFRNFGAFRMALLSNLKAEPRSSPQAHDTVGPTSKSIPSPTRGTTAGPTPRTAPMPSTSTGICAAVSSTRALLDQTHNLLATKSLSASPDTATSVAPHDVADGWQSVSRASRALGGQNPTRAHWEFDEPSTRAVSKPDQNPTRAH